MEYPKFDVVSIDPPWDFKTYSNKGKGRSPEKHYPIMSIDDLCQLPINEITTKNAVMFLWVTWPTIFKYAPRVIESWGFEYKTEAFTWAKTTPLGIYNLINMIKGMINLTKDVFEVDEFMSHGFWHIGTGYYTRANTEPCLLCVKKGGRAPVANKGVRSLIVTPLKRHSQKPDEAARRIEKLYPGTNKIEIFARQRRPGWWALGNEINEGMDIGQALARVLAGDEVPGSKPPDV